jgi:hypothetical protein
MERVIDLGTLLTNEECDKLAGEVIQAYTENKLSLETDVNHYKNSYGGTTPGCWEMLRRFRGLAEEKSGMALNLANPYVRIYNPESTLSLHVDREGLDWTISVCLFTNLDHDWPLKAKVTHWDTIDCPTVKGLASLMNGRIIEHWREPLVCKEDQYVIQLFLHYTEVKI